MTQVWVGSVVVMVVRWECFYVRSLLEWEYGSSLRSIERHVHRFGAHGIRQSQLSSGPIDTHKYADEAAGGDSRAGAWRVP